MRHRGRAALQVLALAGVGACRGALVAESERDAEPDVTPVDGAVSDATSACSPEKPFGPPARVPNLNRPNPSLDAAMRVADDGGFAVFASDRPPASGGALAIFAALRSGGGWGVPGRLLEAPGYSFSYPVLSSDGLELLAQRTLLGSTTTEIVEVRRMRVTDGFGVPSVVDLGTTPSGRGSPFLSSDRKKLYLSAGEPRRLYESDRLPGGLFSLPVAGPFAKVNASLPAAGDAAAPVVSADGRTLYFAARRDGSAFTITRARRSDPEGSFDDLIELTELASAGSDLRPSGISADGCTLWFFGVDGPSDNDLFFAQKTP